MQLSNDVKTTPRETSVGRSASSAAAPEGRPSRAPRAGGAGPAPSPRTHRHTGRASRGGLPAARACADRPALPQPARRWNRGWSRPKAPCGEGQRRCWRSHRASRSVHFAFVCSRRVPCLAVKMVREGKMKLFIASFLFIIYDPNCFSSGFEVITVLMR